MLIDVLVESNIGYNKTFTYLILDKDSAMVEKGKRVLVPFANRQVEGFIMGISNINNVNYEVKEIIKIIDEKPVLNNELLELGIYMSDYYLAPLIKCYQAMLPVALKAKNKPKTGRKMETYVILNESYDSSIVKNEKQIKIIENLLIKIRIRKSDIEDKYALKVLIDKGIVFEERQETYRLKSEFTLKKKPVLTNEQKNAINKIMNDSDKRITLIRGVTGSGKTEIYMNLIEQIIKDNKTAIMLVPEISLTTQLINHFRSRFGDLIAVLHSSLSDGEKYDEWRRIEKGEAKIVVGARSAIFAPLKNIGIIIIDEEHEATYKQENNPMYHALDIAVKRAETHNAKIVLGSATPSLESYARARKGLYNLIELEARINKKDLPEVLVVNMEDEIKRGNRIFSKPLKDSIMMTIQKGEQVILLLNRRGYSNVLTCIECGFTFKCPNCDIALTYHKNNNVLRCHYCGYADRKNDICPKCKSNQLRFYGLGTEKVEEHLKELFKDAKVIRMDLDTTTTKGSHSRIINDFNSGKYDILLGTQMIAKGLDFKKVTLVGVINADSGLNIPDFRSGERTFSLLSQVAGRSGRDELEGKVIFQTYNPDHYIIKMAQKHDYLGFYNLELQMRRKLNYPPFCFVALVKITSKDFEKGFMEAKKIGEYLRGQLPNNQVLGPTVASVSKINNNYYFQCLIKYKNREEIKGGLNYLVTHYQNNKLIKVDVDINAIRL